MNRQCAKGYDSVCYQDLEKKGVARAEALDISKMFDLGLLYRLCLELDNGVDAIFLNKSDIEMRFKRPRF